MRNENCNLIDIGIAHSESASDITDRGARRHGSESDYERGMVIPVFAADVINGFVAFVIRKSMSKSGMLTRSGFRKRSNISP